MAAGNQDPKISLNKLAEYMDASPGRRKTIVRDQKYPATFKAARYGAARQAIVAYAQSYLMDEAGAIAAAEALRADLGESEFVQQDRQLSADAIEKFVDLADGLNIDGLAIQAVPVNAEQTVSFGGTTVSIRPDLLLVNPNGGKLVGAVKVHFSKSSPLTPKTAAYGATALRCWLDAQSGEVDPKRVYVVDVGGDSIVSAPTAKIQRLKDLEAAGEEIRSRWAAL